MPCYTYRCQQCSDVFEVVHSMKETWERCEHCNGSLERVPAQFYNPSEGQGTRAIDEFNKMKEELKDMKEKSRKEYTP